MGDDMSLKKFIKPERLAKLKSDIEEKISYTGRFPNVNILELSKRPWWYCQKYKRMIRICNYQCKYFENKNPFLFCNFNFKKDERILSLLKTLKVKTPGELWIAIFRNMTEEKNVMEFYFDYYQRVWKWDWCQKTEKE